jgi:hypothetical protein
MKRIIAIALLSLSLAACTSGYDAEPTSPQTPDSVPECFVIDRYDDGVKDGLGTDPLGLYCLEDR